MGKCSYLILTESRKHAYELDEFEANRTDQKSELAYNVC